MITIEIDQEIYDYLLKRVQDFGETPADVLRRELGMTPGYKVLSNNTERDRKLMRVLNSPTIRHARGVVGRFLEILGEVYRENQDDFDVVLSIQGKDRKYFARSEKEITDSGTSTQPRRIPGSDYWVLTNKPTVGKKDMLKRVLEALDYSREVTLAAAYTIDDKS